MVLAVAAVGFAACSDWTEMESINETDLNKSTKTEADYAALRAWKETPNLPQVFVWFDNWTGISNGENSLRGLPDSVTIASNWGQPKFDMSPERKADLEYVQKVKGTKVVVTLFAQKIGSDVEHQPIFDTAPGDCMDPEVVRPAIKAYARALYDACMEAGYDGFDWDYEQSSGSLDARFPLWANHVQRAIFIEELSYWFGKGAMDPNRDRGDRPMPAKRLLFLIDGNISGLTLGDKTESHKRKFLTHYVDYYVSQAYGGTSEFSLKNRVTSIINSMQHWINDGLLSAEEIVKRTILTENFESYAGTGGGFLVMSKLIYNQKGIDRQIGGCGIYRVGFDYNQGKGDYNGSPEYYFLRQGITNIYRIFYERLNQAKEEEEETEE